MLRRSCERCAKCVLHRRRSVRPRAASSCACSSAGSTCACCKRLTARDCETSEFSCGQGCRRAALTLTVVVRASRATRYNKFKSRTNIMFCVLPVFNMFVFYRLSSFWGYTNWCHVLTHVWLLCVHCSRSRRSRRDVLTIGLLRSQVLLREPCVAREHFARQWEQHSPVVDHAPLLVVIHVDCALDMARGRELQQVPAAVQSVRCCRRLV